MVANIGLAFFMVTKKLVIRKKDIRNRKVVRRSKVKRANILSKNKKNNHFKDLKKSLVSLHKKLVKIIFFRKKRVRRIRVTKEPETLGEFLEGYKLNSRASLGKSYRRRRIVSIIFSISANFSMKVLAFTSKNTMRALALLAIFVLVGGMTPFVSSAPQSVTVTNKAEWEAGEANNIDFGAEMDSIQLEPDGTWNKRVWGVPQADFVNGGITIGSSSVIAGKYIYITQGGGTREWFLYDTETDTYEKLEELPFALTTGADMGFDGDRTIYMTFGGYSKKFYKYDIVDEAFTELPDALDTICSSSNVESTLSGVLVSRGCGTDFWKFDPDSESWENLAPLPIAFGAGASFVYSNSNNKAYVTRGNNTKTFYSYDVAANSWSVLPALPDFPRFSGAGLSLDQKGTFYHDSGNDKDYVYYINTWSGTPNSGPDSGIAQRYAMMIRYNITDNVWSTWNALDDAPVTSVQFASIQFNSEDGLIYAFRGEYSHDLWKFDPLGGLTGMGTEGAWIGPSTVNSGGDNKGANSTLGTGSDLIWNGVTGAGGYLYVVRGNNTPHFYRYDVSANTWGAPLTNIPVNINNDTKATYADGYIYLLRSGNTSEFYRYNIAANTWSAAGEIANAPATMPDGATLAYNASDGFIYATRGGWTNTFYRYDIGTNTWSTMAGLSSVGSGFSSHGTGVGGRIVSDGTNIYATVGDGETTFLKYDTGANTWSALARTPFVQYYGTDITYANGKIYALAGFYRDETWEYEITSDVWRKLPSVREISYYRGPYNGASIEYAGGNSLYATLGQGLYDLLSLTPGANNYVAQGTYLSDIKDLSNVESWISFVKNDDIPANTSVTYETRTSGDSENWEDWQVVSGTNIASSVNRYIQVRITLASSDGVNAPKVDDWTIAYNSEDLPPQNPTSINALSQRVGGTALVSGNQYPNAHPYFTWTGAQDDGSGIDGYYVYFGTESNADPAVDGTYQAGSFYESNETLQTGNYYLRIKTKDRNGNISDAVWESFQYVYGGVSPSLNISKTSKDDFDAGTNTDINTATIDGSMRLSSTNGFWNEARVANLPVTAYNDGELIKTSYDGADYFFSIVGSNRPNIYQYSPESNVWTSKTNAPYNFYYGGALVAGPEGYLYASAGGNTSTFMRYDIALNSWETVASAPQVFTYGATLTYDGSRYIYATPGNDNSFFRYDTVENKWVTMGTLDFDNPEFTNQAVYNGATTAFDDGDNIYMAQGNAFPYFAKYSISNGEWTALSPAPVSINNGGNISYDSDTNSIYLFPGWDKNFFYKYDIATDTWIRLADSPTTIGYGGSSVIYGRYIYLQTGANTNVFLRYSLEENSWELPVRGIFVEPHIWNGNYYGFGGGTTMTQDEDGNIYTTRGAVDTLFRKYDPETGQSQELAPLPIASWDGSSLAYVAQENAVYYVTSDYIHSRRSNSRNNYFFKYDIDTNTWQSLDNDLPPLQVYNNGVDMIYDGARYLYLTRANGGNVWWRYDTQAVPGSRWSAALPTMTGWAHAAGSSMLYKDGMIYSTRGGSNVTFFKFDVGANSWSQLTNIPGGISSGSIMVDGNDGYIYLTRGGNTSDYYRYKIADNTWETMATMPAQVSYGGGGAGFYFGNRIWVVAGGGTNTYNDGLYSYTISSEANSSGFEKTGTYVSEPLDLISVYEWGNIALNYDQPENTFVMVETRTSSDGVAWDEWIQASNEHVQGTSHTFSIGSQANNFVQVRLTLSSTDQIFSPRVDDWTINYYQDIQEPTNPSVISAYDSSLKGASITDAVWYSHGAPYFEWPEAESVGGATDGVGGSGVVGYWVYFGTDPLADPFVDGTYQTTNNYTAGNLISGENYYLLVKAIDDAGMIATDPWTAFNYKFDNVGPVNPSDISVTPTGFTAIDNYVFLWESNVADAGSGVAKFQYRTGGDVEGVWYDIADPAEVTITIPNADHVVGAYQSGKNWFYLRAVDSAGNASTPISQEYYYSASAPSPPENLTVDPAESEENSFGFSWDKPASFIGEESKLKYFYSINALPTQFNTVETTSTFAGPGPFATQKGSNNFYVVAMDEAANIDYDLYATVEFSANTTAPGAPVNLQIFDTSDRETEAYSIALKWAAPGGIDEDNFAGYVIYRSDDDVTFSQVATTSGTAYVDSELESKLYYYQVKAKDLTNNLSIASSTTSIIPTGRYTSPPLLIQLPEVVVQSFAASFNWGTNRVASSFVEFGQSISLGETNGQVDSVTDHTVDVTGLSAATKYFYRVKYIDPDGNIGTSEIGNFTTLDPPVVSEFTVGDIGLESAYISWKTNTSATCTLKYGAGGYSGSVEETSGASNHIQKITGLAPETAYQVQVSCLDADLNEFDSDQYNFSTPVKPIASEVKIENKDNVDLPTVDVEYKTNVPTTTRVYFKHSDEASPRTYLVEERATEHKAELKGLDPAKEYTLTISGTDENGIAVDPIEQKITTKSDSRPPEILVNRSVGKVLGRGEESQANMYIKIETNEPTKLKIKYSKGLAVSNFDQSTGENPSNNYHLITVPAEVGQMYSYQAEAIDEAGNVTLSKVVTVIVEKAKSSAAEIIMGTTSKQFGWISGIW